MMNEVVCVLYDCKFNKGKGVCGKDTILILHNIRSGDDFCSPTCGSFEERPARYGREEKK